MVGNYPVLYRLWVGQGAESVVVLLSRRVPQAQVDRLPVHHHVGRVVVEPAGRDGKVFGGLFYRSGSGVLSTYSVSGK